MIDFSPLKAALDAVTLIPKTVLSIPNKIAERCKEMERCRELEEKRHSTPPSYDDGVSEAEFEQIVLKAKKGIGRIKSVSIDGFVVSIEVKSQSGISIWNATIDFNDFGHLTGWYKIRSENNDSNIPEAFARDVVEGIRFCKEADGHPANTDDDI